MLGFLVVAFDSLCRMPAGLSGCFCTRSASLLTPITSSAVVPSSRVLPSSRTSRRLRLRARWPIHAPRPAPPAATTPGIATGAFGIVVLLADAPHPNAAKLFVNWMAMREGQETWGRADQSPVVRTDLDNSWAPPYTVPRPEYQYLDGYDWTYVNTAFLESIAKIRQVMALRG